MQVGDSFTFYWAMNFDAGSGGKGFDLKANGSTLFNVNNAGSATITTSNGTANTAYGTSPMLVTATRTSSSEYAFSMTSRSGGATYSTTISTTSAIDSFNLYIGNQSDGAGQRNIFFNNFQVANSGTYNFGGTVTESRALTGGGALTVGGNTTLDLTSTGNTFSGGSTVNAGSTLRIGSGGANGSLSGNVANNGGLSFNSTSVTTYGGQLTGSGTVTKSASGKLDLTGNSSAYAGATLVQAGELAVQNSLGGSVNVSLNAILSGIGTIGGNVSVSGSHAPGGATAVGVQQIDGNLTYQAGSILNWNLVANTTGGTGNFDQVVLPTGDLNFAGATSLQMTFNSAGSAVDWSNSFWNVNRTWLLQDLSSGVTSNVGNFSIATQNWVDGQGATLSSARPDATFNIGVTGQDVVINYVAVPEPTTTVALIGGIAALAGFASRRRSCR